MTVYGDLDYCATVSIQQPIQKFHTRQICDCCSASASVSKATSKFG